MTLRKVLRNGLPDPAEVEDYSLIDQLSTSPIFLPVRIFWGSLNDFRPYWPILVPLLLLLGVRVYRRERAAYLLERALGEVSPDLT